MVSSTYLKFGLRLNAVWFCADIPGALEKSKADFVFLHGVNRCELDNSMSNRQNTLITDLTEANSEISAKFVHGYRRQIAQAEKESINCCIYSSEDIKNQPMIIAKFRQAFRIFTRQKGVACNFNDSAVRSYIQAGGLIVSKAYSGETDYVQHMYIVDGQTARCVYSVSNFRGSGLDKRMVGRANKLLHWRDIQYFKQQGYTTYDWGGITSATEPTGVDTFKLGFGGSCHHYYNIIVGKSAVGKLAINLRKMTKLSFFS